LYSAYTFSHFLKADTDETRYNSFVMICN